MKILDEFEISDTAKLCLSVGEYKGNERIDLRQYFKVDNEFFPSRKGVSLSMEWVDKLILMCEKLKEL